LERNPLQGLVIKNRLENRFLTAIQVHARLIAVIMLRDMRTRFGRTYWHYLVQIGWPLSHLLGIVIAFLIANRILPFGNDSVTYISTGALPYVLCLYPARLSALTFMQNRAVLAFPIVQPIDVMLARITLEALSACIVCMIYCCGLWALDVDFLPQDWAVALTGIYATIFFGISLGVFVMMLAALFGMAGYIIFIMVMIGLYMASGVYIPITVANENIRYLQGFNPMVHLVEWVRSAYFEMHSPVELSKSYMLFLSGGLLVTGLAGERLFRGRILRGL
jgi:capsular polysaccharide transport system permease protein